MATFIFFLFLFISPSFSAFLAPITKRHLRTTPFYTLKVHLKTPLQPTDLLLHLGATFTAVDCTHNYTSATSRPVPCNSSLCHSLQSSEKTTCDTTAGDSVPGGCVVLPHNSVALVDSLALPVTNGRNPGRLGLIPEFVFTCSNESTRLLKGHAKKEVTGLAGFGFSKFSLPAQVSSNATTTASVFAICLSGSPSAPGVAFFDHAKPYYFFPEIDVSDHLNYTPLFSYPISITTRNDKRFEDAYFIGVKSINVNGKPIDIDEKLLAVDENGHGGTRISTTNPYTTLQRPIYRAFVEAFSNESTNMKLKPAEPIKPFKLCYEADYAAETDFGPSVPVIEFVMQNDVVWRVYGRNLMKRFVDFGLDVWCLTVMDGGATPTSAMVIGGHQLEENLVQFDLGRRQLGFSSSLLEYKTMCGNFNFSTNNNITLS